MGVAVNRFVLSKRTTRTIADCGDIDSITTLEFEDRLVKVLEEQRGQMNVMLISFDRPFADRSVESMIDVIERALNAWESNGLILDLRKLSCDSENRNQGNVNFSFTSSGGADHTSDQRLSLRVPPSFPTAIIASDQFKVGIASWLTKEHRFEGEVVQTEQEAIEYIQAQWNAPIANDNSDHRPPSWLGTRADWAGGLIALMVVCLFGILGSVAISPYIQTNGFERSVEQRLGAFVGIVMGGGILFVGVLIWGIAALLLGCARRNLR